MMGWFLGWCLVQYRGFCTWYNIGGFVPGTISAFCTWYNIGVLCLVQYRRSVPGTISAFCAWYNIGVLCLAQFRRPVPGTRTVMINGTWLKTGGLIQSPPNVHTNPAQTPTKIEQIKTPANRNTKSGSQRSHINLPNYSRSLFTSSGYPAFVALLNSFAQSTSWVSVNPLFFSVLIPL
jgi:hypothetical protein